MTRTAELFWVKVDKEGPVHPTLGMRCWLWTASRYKSGYGQFGSARSRRANRVAWQLVHGVIPDGLFVLHHCDNPPCVNPEHLFLGTPLDNMRDRDAKGRRIGNRFELKTHCKRGHEFTPENTYRTPAGRSCRACWSVKRNLRPINRHSNEWSLLTDMSGSEWLRSTDVGGSRTSWHTKALNRLVRRGLVERRPWDNRAFVYRLTQAGKALVLESLHPEIAA